MIGSYGEGLTRSRGAALLAVAALLLSSSVAAAQTSPPVLERADLEAWLDGLVPYALEQSDIAGAVVAVVKDGGVLLQKGYGWADVASRTPMDPERTVIGVGSVSKLFTWTAVMQQVERGALELDRAIAADLDIEIPAAFGAPITLRHLMTHTAGFEDRSFRQASSPRALGAYLRQTPVPARIDPPGELVAYSNYGSMLGGYLVERVTGEPWVEYVERHVLAPLGMTSSTFARPIPERLRARVATDYWEASGEPKPPNDEEPAGDPSGHLVTTAADMSRFMLAHLQEGWYGGRQLLAPETVRLMHTSTFEPVPGAQPVALGFFRWDHNGRRVLWHGGDISGFHADLQLLPDEGVGVFVGLNSDGVAADVLDASITLRTSLSRGFLDRYFPAPPLPEEPTLATAREHAELAAGPYRMSRRPSGDFAEAVLLIASHFAIDQGIEANADGTIATPGWMSFRDGRPKRWREVRPFVWREVGGSALLTMRVEDGEVTQFFTGDIPTTWTNVRVPVARSPALNVPPFVAAAAVLLLATLLWPVAALARRRYGAPLDLEPRDAKARRVRQWAALLGAAYLLGWMALLAADPTGRDGWIRLVQMLGLACVVGAAAAAWAAWTTARGRRGWVAKAGGVLVALALLEVVRFSFAFHLISLRLNY